MSIRFASRLLAALMICAVSGTVAAQWDSEREQDARETVAHFKQTNPKLGTMFERAYGYAVFPTVAKGGIGLGGAYGKGVVFEQGRAIGTTSLVQLTIGLQFGGQAYSEILLFENRAALESFKGGEFELGAQASAVAVTAGASVDIVFQDGIAIYTLTKGGLMYEASVGGQSFRFEPREAGLATTATNRSSSAATAAAGSNRQAAAQRAYDAGNYREAHSLWQQAAREGDLESLYELGKLYGEGQGVLQDYVTAHAYFNVAAAKGHQGAVQARQILAGRMSASELARARELAADYWNSFNPQPADSRKNR